MSIVATPVNGEKQRIFETILSSPGMSEKCKISFQISRQTILLLCRLIEGGLLSENGLGDEVLAVLSNQTTEEMKGIHEELLRKGGLVDFYQRLKSL